MNEEDIDLVKRFWNNRKKKNNQDIKYQYSYVDMKEVIKNPDEYIIPECQKACQALWNKNIETFMVSNYDDNYLYVLVTKLSQQNEDMIEQLMRTDQHYFYSSYRETYGIRVNGTNDEAGEELAALTEPFKIQDTFRFQTIEDYMKSNPDMSLIDSLKKENKEQLCLPEEGRIYDDEMYLKWHNRYLDKTSKKVK